MDRIAGYGAAIMLIGVGIEILSRFSLMTILLTTGKVVLFSWGAIAVIVFALALLYIVRGLWRTHAGQPDGTEP